ncbi:MAG: sigma 54-interacting transcriptional regulator [Deltaproteobacteria bacterium]|nr:sigma 54-interacting transcriptional regulator [Deltaproteobacteria bacterium]
MRADDLQRLELIDIDSVSGFPFLGSHRLMVFSTASLGRLRKDLQRAIGPEQTKVILARHSYETGMVMAMAIGELYEFDTPEEWLKAGSRIRTMAGLAHEHIETISLDKETKRLCFQGTWQDSFEVHIWKESFGVSAESICVMLAGMLSGYASTVMGAEVLVRELACQAQGESLCRFEGRTVAEWGLTSEEVQAVFAVGPIGEELVSLKAALLKANDELDLQHRQIQRLKQLAYRRELKEDIIFRSESMAKTLMLAEKVAPSASTVLILGESGTGKEVLAKFIHRNSGRKDRPFLAINCAALPPNLLESELFGHLKGSFTGADRDKRGLCVEAGEGTLFLDEVGEVPLEMQAKLLRVLQEKRIRPVGGVRDIPVTARIIAATNRNLHEMVQQGAFREDLYYRLAVFPVIVMPLRDRRQDILLLARHFLSRLKKIHRGFSPESVRMLEAYSWPGNVRELENWMEYAVIMAGDDLIRPEHFPLAPFGEGGSFNDLTADYPSLDELAQRYISRVLGHTGGNKREAARILGIGASTLWRRLKNTP